MQHPAITAEQCARRCPSRCGAGISQVTGVILFPPFPSFPFPLAPQPQLLVSTGIRDILERGRRGPDPPYPRCPLPNLAKASKVEQFPLCNLGFKFSLSFFFFAPLPSLLLPKPFLSFLSGFSPSSHLFLLDLPA